MTHDHRRSLDTSYDRYCIICNNVPVHRTNSVGVCADCIPEWEKMSEEQRKRIGPSNAEIQQATREALKREWEEANLVQGEGVKILKETLGIDPPVPTEYTKERIKELQAGVMHKDELREHPLQIPQAGGKTLSSKTDPFHLIPSIALIRLAQRFQLGEERKKDKAWNALSNNQDALLDKSWAIERIDHIIAHALKLRDKLHSGNIEAIQADDDAAAIAWAGCFLICVTDAITQKEKGISMSQDVRPNQPDPEVARQLAREFATKIPSHEINQTEKKPYPKCPKCGTKTGVYKEREARDRFICQPCEHKFVVEGFD